MVCQGATPRPYCIALFCVWWVSFPSLISLESFSVLFGKLCSLDAPFCRLLESRNVNCVAIGTGKSPDLLALQAKPEISLIIQKDRNKIQRICPPYQQFPHVELGYVSVSICYMLPCLYSSASFGLVPVRRKTTWMPGWDMMRCPEVLLSPKWANML